VRMANPLPGRYDLTIDWSHSAKRRSWAEAVTRPSPRVYQ